LAQGGEGKGKIVAYEGNFFVQSTRGEHIGEKLRLHGEKEGSGKDIQRGEDSSKGTSNEPEKGGRLLQGRGRLFAWSKPEEPDNEGKNGTIKKSVSRIRF